MSNIGMLVGALMLLTGTILQFLHTRYCQWLVTATENFPNPLTTTEVWLNTRSEIKQHKLLDLSESEEPEIRRHAVLALHFNTGFFVFFVPGMVILFFSAVAASNGT